MKILIISDTHGRISPVEKILNNDKSITDIIHLGDCVSDAIRLKEEFKNINMHYVKGNNDYFSDAPCDIIENFFGHNVFMTHGHRYHVKTTVSELLKKAESSGCDIVLFGHTHLKYNNYISGIHLFNPSAYGYIILTEKGAEFKNY